MVRVLEVHCTNFPVALHEPEATLSLMEVDQLFNMEGMRLICVAPIAIAYNSAFTLTRSEILPLNRQFSGTLSLKSTVNVLPE